MKKLLLAVSLVIFSTLSYGQCTTISKYRVNNSWQPSQNIPYGMVFEIYNAANSGCDVYITGIYISAASNLPYIVFGTAYALNLMPGCTLATQVVNVEIPFSISTLPPGITPIGLPCGSYINIGTTPDQRWTLASGIPLEVDLLNKPRKISPNIGYSLWASPANYPTNQFSIGDLTISLEIKTCPTNSVC